ncbi:unnamed protein product [Dovyalis caffra]|uniref:Uncharacterized protein n=1 Tax=Dovyalis caffra TaxID=77055 RepID=A0AAV1R7E7_9ROSI|nr:unnamed protein product [Dovyalis caffra]
MRHTRERFATEHWLGDEQLAEALFLVFWIRESRSNFRIAAFGEISWAGSKKKASADGPQDQTNCDVHGPKPRKLNHDKAFEVFDRSMVSLGPEKGLVGLEIERLNKQLKLQQPVPTAHSPNQKP